jgi:hypothetical protein
VAAIAPDKTAKRVNAPRVFVVEMRMGLMMFVVAAGRLRAAFARGEDTIFSKSSRNIQLRPNVS